MDVAASDQMSHRRPCDPASGSSEAVLRPAPSLRYEDLPRERPKREIEVSEAAARLANALHLHVD